MIVADTTVVSILGCNGKLYSTVRIFRENIILPPRNKWKKRDRYEKKWAGNTRFLARHKLLPTQPPRQETTPKRRKQKCGGRPLL